MPRSVEEFIKEWESLGKPTTTKQEFKKLISKEEPKEYPEPYKPRKPKITPKPSEKLPQTTRETPTPAAGSQALKIQKKEKKLQTQAERLEKQREKLQSYPQKITSERIWKEYQTERRKYKKQREKVKRTQAEISGLTIGMGIRERLKMEQKIAEEKKTPAERTREKAAAVAGAIPFSFTGFMARKEEPRIKKQTEFQRKQRGLTEYEKTVGEYPLKKQIAGELISKKYKAIKKQKPKTSPFTFETSFGLGLGTFPISTYRGLKKTGKLIYKTEKQYAKELSGGDISAGLKRKARYLKIGKDITRGAGTTGYNIGYGVLGAVGSKAGYGKKFEYGKVMRGGQAAGEIAGVTAATMGLGAGFQAIKGTRFGRYMLGGKIKTPIKEIVKPVKYGKMKYYKIKTPKTNYLAG